MLSGDEGDGDTLILARTRYRYSSTLSRSFPRPKGVISDFRLTGNAIARLLPPRERSRSLSVTGLEIESVFPNTARRVAGVRLSIAWISLIKE